MHKLKEEIAIIDTYTCTVAKLIRMILFLANISSFLPNYTADNSHPQVKYAYIKSNVGRSSHLGTSVVAHRA